MPKTLIIISLDAVGTKDLPYMKTLPTFSNFFQKAAMCDKVESVYPTLTYPAHTSIVTGKMPVNHKIVSNHKFQPSRLRPDWMWYADEIQGKTLYGEAQKKGMRTSSLLWPVTAGSSIQYCVPEIYANRPWQNNAFLFAKYGSFLYELDLFRRYGSMMDGVKQPQLDQFVYHSAVYTINKYHPDLMLIHLTDADTNRHLYGVEAPQIKEALNRHDDRLKGIMEAVDKNYDWDSTAMVILGDHYQVDAHTVVYLNRILEEKGYLQVKNGRITKYKAVFQGNNGSAYLYLNKREKNNAQLRHNLRELIFHMSESGEYGIEKIISGNEAGELGAESECFYMIEAKAGFCYLDGNEVMFRKTSEEKNHYVIGIHGYSPKKPDYTTFFAGYGCGFAENQHVSGMNLCDVGVTLAKLLGVSLGETDGTVIRELLN